MKKTWRPYITAKGSTVLVGFKNKTQADKFKALATEFDGLLFESIMVDGLNKIWSDAPGGPAYSLAVRLDGQWQKGISAGLKVALLPKEYENQKFSIRLWPESSVIAPEVDI